MNESFNQINERIRKKKIVMNCRRIQKKLSSFQDGQLNAEERMLVETHLRSCPSCHGVYANMEEVWQSLYMIDEIEPSRDFYSHLYWKINKRANQRQRFKWFMQLFPAPVVTFALLLIGVLLGAFLGNTVVKVGPWFVTQQTNYSQALSDVDFFKVFASAPPGTLGNSYIRLASTTEEYSK